MHDRFQFKSQSKLNPLKDSYCLSWPVASSGFQALYSCLVFSMSGQITVEVKSFQVIFLKSNSNEIS